MGKNGDAVRCENRLIADDFIATQTYVKESTMEASGPAPVPDWKDVPGFVDIVYAKAAEGIAIPLLGS